MLPADSLLSRISLSWSTVLWFAVILAVTLTVLWFIKPEPKSILSFVRMGVGLVVLGAVVLYFVKMPGHQLERMKREGTAASATVLQVESLNVVVNRRPQVRMRLRVEADGQPAYEVTHVDLVALGQSVVPGRRLRVYVDRTQPDRLAIDWSGSTDSLTEPSPAATQDVSTRLAELDRLRERGQITQAEYEAHRQRVLSNL